MVRWVPVLVALLLAGCADDGGGEPAPDDTAPEDVAALEADAPSEPTFEEASVDWTDSLERGVWTCNPEFGCEYAPSSEVYNAVFEQSLPVGNITSGNLSISWQPVSQVTEDLVFGYRIYTPDCDSCTSRYGTEIAGTSPLTAQLSADMYVAEGEVLRMWVYGSMIQGENTTGTYMGLSDDQPFVVEGDVVVEQTA